LSSGFVSTGHFNVWLNYCRIRKDISGSIADTGVDGLFLFHWQEEINMTAADKFCLIILHGLLVFLKFLANGFFIRRSGCITVVCFALAVPASQAAFEKVEIGAAALGMGNAVIAYVGLPNAVHYNPAAIRVQGTFDFAFTYRTFFGIKGVRQADLVSNFSIAGRSFSIGINHFGNEYYTEIQTCLGSAYDFGRGINMGISFQLYHLSIKGYGEALAWGVHCGILVELLPSLALGAQMTNLNRPQISVSGEKLPQRMALGLSYTAAEKMYIVFAVYRDIHFGPEYRAGMAYQLTKGFTIRAGLEDSIETVSTGCGITVNDFCFDYALRIHQTLGLSHILSLYLSL